MSNNPKNLEGMRFGKLTPIKRVSSRRDASGRSRTFWLCKCDCGNEKEISTNALQNTHTTNCGCALLRTQYNVGAQYGQIFITYKYSAEQRNIQFDLTVQQVVTLVKENCFYCDQKPDTEKRIANSDVIVLYNGIDRINNDKGYDIDNVVACCKHCNRAKNAQTFNSFIARCKRITYKFN